MAEEKVLESKVITAETMAKDFKEHSVAEFFKKNKQMLGLYGKVRTLTTIVHEYVTNSLDACEEANILPDIEVKLEEIAAEYYEVTVKDNGPGLTKETVGKALGKLLAGTKFHRMIQSRGQQGIGACMKSDTLVPMVDGSILSIKEIVDKDMVGEEVISLDLDSLKLVPGKIIKCWKPKNPLFVKVKTIKGREISLTPENPVLTLEEGKPIWIRADEITKGMKIAAPNCISAFPQNKLTIELFDESKIQVDNSELLSTIAERLIKRFGSYRRIAKELGVHSDVLRNWTRRKMPNGNPRGHPTLKQLLEMSKLAGFERQETIEKVNRVGRNGSFANIPVYIDNETAWLAGVIAGDGHMSSSKDDKWGVNITFTNNDIELIKLYKGIIENKFGLKTQQYFHKEKKYYTVQCSSKILSEILEFFGVTRGNKIKTLDLSNGLLSLNEEIIAAYLRGIFDAEGSVSKEKGMVTAILYNKKVIEKIFYALLRQGIHANINKQYEENRITITGRSNIYKFCQKVGFSASRKSNLLIELLQKEKTNAKTDTMQGISKSVVQYLRELEKPLTCLPSASYSALYNQNMSRNSLMQVLQTVGVKGEKGKLLNSLAEAQVSWLEVTETAFEKNEEEVVYDLEIEKYHNFVAGGIICHNSGCTMLSQTTTGKTSKVITGTGKGKPISLEISIDPKLNQPKISNLKELDKEYRGLAVQSKFKGILYRDSEQGPLEYLRRTAIANPHAQIKFTDPSRQKFLFKRSANAIPKPPVAVKPHPKGVTVDEMVTLSKYTESRKVSSFLRSDFDRIGQKSLEEIAKKVSFDLNKDPKQLRWDEAEEIVKAFKAIDFIAPSSDALRPIGEERIGKSLENIVEPEFLHVLTRKPQVYSGGFPFQVEVAIAYGGKAGRTVSTAEGNQKRLEIMRFANRAPLLFDAGNCAITKAVHSIDWKRYDVKDIDNSPITVLVNFISVYVPYMGAGKQAIADEEEVVEEIRLALMQSGRKAGRYISGKKREAERLMKRELFYKYIPEIVNALNQITKEDKTVLDKKLRKMVMTKLKLDDEKDAEENGNGETEVVTEAEGKEGKKEEKGQEAEKEKDLEETGKKSKNEKKTKAVKKKVKGVKSNANEKK